MNMVISCIKLECMKFFNLRWYILRWYIQHLMDENEDEDENPLSHEYWMKQTKWKFIKYVIHHKHSMTPEQLKQKPFEEVLRFNMKYLIQRKGSQMNRKRNPPHPQKSWNKILSLSGIPYKGSNLMFKLHSNLGFLL